MFHALVIPLSLLMACGQPDETDGPADTETDAVADADGDGVTVDDGDCAPTDGTVFPGAAEVPYDGIDQDCDGSDLTDADGDGFDGPVDPDCDDSDAESYPGADDPHGDAIDQDCDGFDGTEADRRYLGDLTFTTPESMDVFCTHYDTVLGSVNIVANGLDDLSALACLRRVEGNLGVEGASLVAVDLPNLERVAVDLTVVLNDTITRVSFPLLGDVGGDIALPDAAGLLAPPVMAMIDLRSLRTVGGNVPIDASATRPVTEVHLESLTDVAGDLSLAVAQIEVIDLPALRTVGGEFGVGSASQTADVRTPMLSSVGGDLLAYSAFVDFPLLEEVGGVLSADTSDLPALVSAGRLFIFGPTVYAPLFARGDVTCGGALTNLSLPSFVAGALRVEGASSLTVIDLPAYSDATSLDIRDNPKLTAIGLPQLASAGSVFVWGNPLLTSFEAPALTTSIQVNLYGNVALETLDLSALTIGNVAIDENLPAVLDLHSLVTGSVRLDAFQWLSTEIDWSAMQSHLTTVDLSSLAHSNDIYIGGYPLLTTIDLHSLQTVTTDLIVEDNQGLETLSVGALSSVGRKLFILDGGPSAVNLPALVTVRDLRLSDTSDKWILDEWQICGNNLCQVKSHDPSPMLSVNLPAFQTATNILFTQNDRVPGLNLPSLTRVEGQVLIGDNPALSALSAPLLDYVGGICNIYSNRLLPTSQVTTLQAGVAFIGGYIGNSGNGPG